MDIDSILTIILACGPAVISISSGIGVMVNVINNFNQLRQEVKSRTDYNEFKSRLNMMAEQITQLQSTMQDFMAYTKAHPTIKAKED